MKSRIIATFSRLSRWISWLLLTEKWIYRVFPIIWGCVNKQFSQSQETLIENQEQHLFKQICARFEGV